MMEDRPYFYKIKDFVQNIVKENEENPDQMPLSSFGAVNCRYRQRIAEVPFLYPSLVLVISGQKSIYYGEKEVQCSSGDYLAIPAPSKFDVINTPYDSQQVFLALYLYFDIPLVERFRRSYQMEEARITNNFSIHFEGNQLLDSAIWHFLEITKQPKLIADIIEHRLMGVLLCLVKYCNASHMLLSMSQKWSERVYSLLLANPSRMWQIKDVCTLLNVSESTLRRNLRNENTSYRSIVEDVRMGLALSEVQFTQLPISIIAENCGYSSFSRFTSRFRRRFDITPSQLRKEMAESG